ncbi:MAG: hypothetical protein C0481_21280 [Phenylobacterium sp.]|uniref:hypothetical protein n=1 Tax=Phenylobacterium sp. TaxID=1871053 RepID=UPI0025F93653|nr:hypothetical protein [Phenylobacterium sp.]MBA4014398.1 hypothetical protein [Phenylobacterium sp.]
MTPIIALSVGLGLLAQGTFGGSGGTLKPQPGPWGPAPAAARPSMPPTYVAPAPAQRRATPSLAPPAFPAAPKAPEMYQPPNFKPYKPGVSPYSERGGMNAHPKPAKPPGYIELP